MRQESITKIITTELTPSHLEVVNESDMHQGPPGRLKLYTGSEWQKLDGQANLNSPDCSHKK